MLNPASFKYPTAIFGNAIGDHLLALPALRAVAAIFPGRLNLICMPGFRETFFADVPLRSVCEIEMQQRKRRREFDAARAARKVKQCDIFLSLNPWHSGSVNRLLELLSPTVSVGFSAEFTVALPKDSRKHATESAFEVPHYFKRSLRLEDFAFPPRFAAPFRSYARRLRNEAARNRRILALHTETKPQKAWPPDRFAKLLEVFLTRHPDFVVFILDLRKPTLGTDKVRDRIFHWSRLPFQVALPLLEESDLFLGVDSCMLHAADLYRIPGVGLFGPTSYEQWGFRFSPHRHLRDARGMDHIPVAGVLNAMESLLS